MTKEQLTELKTKNLPVANMDCLSKKALRTKTMLNAYACRTRWYKDETIIHHTSPNKAKVRFLQQLDMDDVQYTDIRCRKIESLQTLDDFKRNAVYRNIPFAEIGMTVKLGEETGIIVGHNSSANLDVLFEEGKYKGQVLNCHPNWKIKYFDKADNLIKEFMEN